MKILAIDFDSNLNDRSKYENHFKVSLTMKIMC